MRSDDLDHANTPAQTRIAIVEGRVKLLTGSFAVVCVCVFTIIQYNLAIGPKKLPAQIVRLCLTLWLCSAVYKGSTVAKWIAVVLCYMGAASFLYLYITLDNLDWLMLASIFANAVSYAYYVCLLVGSKDVKAFLDSKRR